MATERISILALDDAEAVKLGDNVKLYFGDGADPHDNNVGDVSLVWNGSSFVMAGGELTLSSTSSTWPTRTPSPSVTVTTCRSRGTAPTSTSPSPPTTR